MVYDGRMSIKLISPSTVRLTIPVNLETHAVFQRLAKVGKMSTGRAMGEWLTDTVEAAELMASTMERARSAPKIVTAELHAMMLGMTDQTKELMDKFSRMKGASQAGGGERSAPRSAGPFSGLTPPSSNTGGKGTKSTPIPSVTSVKKSIPTLGKSPPKGRK